jgi:hypothetical protein
VRRRAARGGARLAQGAQGRVCNGGSRATSAPPPPPPPLLAGAIEEYVGSAEELLQIVRIGDANRVVGSTGMNDVSSRSHSVLQIGLEVRDTATRSLQHSKLCLVDLAGSESVSRTGAEGVVLDEARTINKSLFNLAKCIAGISVHSINTIMDRLTTDLKSTHSLTHSLTHLLTHSLAHLLTHSLIYSLTHSLTYLLTHSLTHLLTHLLTHSQVNKCPINLVLIVVFNS